MLTKTTRSGLQALLYLSMQKSVEPVSPRVLAEVLGCSPTYLAKVTGQLVRAGILTAHKGVKGGVTLSRPPRAITLLEVVQALQGPVLADYCSSDLSAAMVCQFHRAMYALHQAMLETLTRWSLADIAKVPDTNAGAARNSACIMHPVVVELNVSSRKRGRK